MRLHAKQVLLCPESGTIVLRYSDLHDEMGTTVSDTCNRAPAGVWFYMPIAYNKNQDYCYYAIEYRGFVSDRQNPSQILIHDIEVSYLINTRIHNQIPRSRIRLETFWNQINISRIDSKNKFILYFVRNTK